MSTHKTQYIVVIDHTKPLNPETLGQMLSASVSNMARHPQLAPYVTHSTVTLMEYNQVVQ